MKIQKKYKTASTVLIIVLIIFLILPLLLQFLLLTLTGGAVDGSFGLRPMSHGCIGLIISSEKVIRLFPKGDVEFEFLFHFRYFMSSEFSDRMYCLGQDIWYGE